LVAGETPDNSIESLRDQLLSSGFADVTILTGTPPELNHAATSSAAA
jgi:hypothetical protein